VKYPAPVHPDKHAAVLLAQATQVDPEVANPEVEQVD